MVLKNYPIEAVSGPQSRGSSIGQVCATSLIFRASEHGLGGLCFGSRGLVNAFDNRGDALPHADTHGREAIATAAPFHFVNECCHEPCATAAEGVTEGDGAAVDV
jgi:hypothetical protein